MFEALPPVISEGTYQRLLAVQRLAQNVYLARTNFTNLCAELEKLYEHFDAGKTEKAA